jgi:hypothetical protein
MAMAKKKKSALVLAFGPSDKEEPEGDKGAEDAKPSDDGFDMACKEAFEAVKGDDYKAFASAMKSAVDMRMHADPGEDDTEDDEPEPDEAA